jgi:DNA-binding MarR family transcriptional regulator
MTTATTKQYTEIKHLLMQIFKLSKEDLEERLKQTTLGITPFQFGILHIINCHTTTGSKLAKTMCIEPPTLVPVIDALEQKGLVERKIDLTDRRRIPLLITATGKKILKHLPLIHPADKFVQRLDKLGAKKTEQLFLLLNDLVKSS